MVLIKHRDIPHKDIAFDEAAYYDMFTQNELLKQALAKIKEYSREYPTPEPTPPEPEPLVREYTTTDTEYPPLLPPQRERITRLDRRELDKIIQSCREEIREIDRELDREDISRENRKRLETRRKRVNAKITMAHVQIDGLEEGE